MLRIVWALAAMLALTFQCSTQLSRGIAQTLAEVTPAIETEPVPEDPDDPAIWINQADPAKSLILGTNKSPAPSGSVVVFGLDGKIRQSNSGIDRPNNIDVEYGVAFANTTIDIAVVTERLQNKLRVFKVDANGLKEIASFPVFVGETGDSAAPMGVALYRRPSDKAVFAIVGRKFGPTSGYLWQYRLETDELNGLRATKVREFGYFSGREEIEAIAVDDELGFVYYADEGGAIRKWHADPEHPNASKELAKFGVDGFVSDREGIAIVNTSSGRGYLVCTDQIDGNSQYRIFRREGTGADPHDHSELVKVFRGGADATDGIDATTFPLGEAFPSGLFVAMNSSSRNFLLFRWGDIARAGTTKLQLRQAKQ